MYLALGLIGSDGGLSTLCHSCKFACQQRVLKRFLALAISAPSMGYSDYGIHWQICIDGSRFHLGMVQSLWPEG